MLVRDLSPFNLPLLSTELFALFTWTGESVGRSIARQLGRQLEKYAKNSAQIKKPTRESELSANCSA